MPKRLELPLEENVIAEETIRNAVYQAIVKVATRRLERSIPGSSEEAFAELSAAELLNLPFLTSGEMASLGDFITTHTGLRTLLGDKLFFAKPPKSATVPESIN